MAPKKTLNKQRFFLQTLVSLSDQGLLSALNLLTGLLLIRWVSKEEYGIYAQLFALGLFVSTLIEALISNPLTTIAPGKPEQEKHALFAQLYKLQWPVNLILSMAFGIGSSIAMSAVNAHPTPWLLGMTFALYVLGNAQRDFLRSILFIQGMPSRVLRIDLAYAAAVIAGTAILLWLQQLTIVTVLLLLGGANGVALSLAAGTIPKADTTLLSMRTAISVVWLRARWAVPGALIAWFINYSYLFLAAILLGAAATADLNAARLLLMPVALAVIAWSRIARPLASRMYAAKAWPQLNRLTWISVVGIETLTIMYIGLLWLALPFLQDRLLGPEYAATETLVLVWGGYFVLNAARWVGFSWLASNDQYKAMMLTNIAGLVTMLACFFTLVPKFGTTGAIASLAIVETIYLALTWFVLIPQAKKVQQ